MKVVYEFGKFFVSCNFASRQDLAAAKDIGNLFTVAQ
jgi:hypothetical protein